MEQVDRKHCWPLAAGDTLRKRELLEHIAVDRLGFIFYSYRVDVWYWEICELLRRFQPCISKIKCERVSDGMIALSKFPSYGITHAPIC